MTQAVILAGGKGTRLAARLGGLPKPLVDVAGQPLLGRQIAALAAGGVDEIVLLVNHAAERIAAYLESQDLPCRVTVLDDGQTALGTAGALLNAFPALRERFLVVYGDTLFDIDVAHMVDQHVARNADVTLLLHPNDHPHDSDLVEVDAEGWVAAFRERGAPALQNLVNAAFYVVERRALEAWRDFATPSDLAQSLFPRMLEAGARIHGYRSLEYIKDIGTPDRLDRAERHLLDGVVARARRAARQRAVFLDRDGTLNALNGHIHRPEDLTLLPGAAQAVRLLNDAEFRVVLVTNQPVIARGECTEGELRAIHGKLESELGAAHAFLDATYYCPHHPDGGFPGERPELKIVCTCRKPAPGLILAAALDLNIDLRQSWFVGDSTGDLLAARRAGVRSILVRTGEGGRDGKHLAGADFSADDVLAAAELITLA